MTSYVDLTAPQIAALRHVFDVLNAHHAPPFAAEFLDEFWSLVLAAVLKDATTQQQGEP